MATYGAGVFEQIKAAGAEVLVAAPEVQVLEGKWHGNWTIVVKYPSMEAALDSYNATDGISFIDTVSIMPLLIRRQWTI